MYYSRNFASHVDTIAAYIYIFFLIFFLFRDKFKSRMRGARLPREWDKTRGGYEKKRKIIRCWNEDFFWFFFLVRRWSIGRMIMIIEKLDVREREREKKKTQNKNQFWLMIEAHDGRNVVSFLLVKNEKYLGRFSMSPIFFRIYYRRDWLESVVRGEYITSLNSVYSYVSQFRFWKKILYCFCSKTILFFLSCFLSRVFLWTIR